MGWVKRNLFFVIGGVLALGLLGAAGFYDWNCWHRNTTAYVKLNEIYNQIKELNSHKPSPGNEQINNIEAARQQERELRNWIRQSRDYFRPIAPIPSPASGPLSDPVFGDALHQTIDQLTHEAAAANVGVEPAAANFSFTVLRDRVSFAAGGLNPLAAQLGEVKAICEVFFAAGVNELDEIRRVKVSLDDNNGPQSDYLAGTSVTNSFMVTTPYVITFRSFSPEIARVLSGLASSPNGFVVKGINVEPASGVAGTAQFYQPQPSGMTHPPAAPGFPPAFPPAFPRSTYTAPVQAAPSGGPKTILQEQLLRTTIEVEIIKLSARN
ncbi:MAG: hypothetical protein ABSE16_07355 [Verrucomicrobiota bacterium]|jgi:hypothetical protein